MDWTTGLRPISSPLLGTFHKYLTTNIYIYIFIFNISFVSIMKPALISSM